MWMKIWEVKLATEDGGLTERLVKADDYQQAVEIVTKAALANNTKWEKLDARERKTLHVQKVELYCETDVGE